MATSAGRLTQAALSTVSAVQEGETTDVKFITKERYPMSIPRRETRYDATPPRRHVTGTTRNTLEFKLWFAEQTKNMHSYKEFSKFCRQYKVTPANAHVWRVRAFPDLHVPRTRTEVNALNLKGEERERALAYIKRVGPRENAAHAARSTKAKRTREEKKVREAIEATSTSSAKTTNEEAAMRLAEESENKLIKVRKQLKEAKAQIFDLRVAMASDEDAPVRARLDEALTALKKTRRESSKRDGSVNRLTHALKEAEEKIESLQADHADVLELRNAVEVHQKCRERLRGELDAMSEAYQVLKENTLKEDPTSAFAESEALRGQVTDLEERLTQSRAAYDAQAQLYDKQCAEHEQLEKIYYEQEQALRDARSSKESTPLTTREIDITAKELALTTAAFTLGLAKPESTISLAYLQEGYLRLFTEVLKGE